MILSLDLGNSRIKAVLAPAAAPLAERTQVHACSWNETPRLIKKLMALSKPELIAVCAVVSRQRQERILAPLRRKWRTRVLTLTPLQVPLETAYRGAGVDRLLLAWGAGHFHRAPCVIVSAGTAITCDLLDRRLKFLGGYILAGLPLLTSAINQGTDGVRLRDQDLAPLSLRPPLETRAAAGQGLQAQAGYGAAGLVRHLLALAGRNSRLIVTGGDASRLTAYLPDTGVILDPRLLLRSLHELTRSR